MKTEAKTDIYARVTDHIIASLELGVRPWQQPWTADHTDGRITRPLRHNREKYSGINILTLWMSASSHGFASPFWMTFQHAKELKAHVRKGEHGSPVVYASSFRKTETDDDGEEVEQDIAFLKEYTVFYVYSYCTVMDLEFRLVGMTRFALATSPSEHLGMAFSLDIQWFPTSIFSRIPRLWQCFWIHFCTMQIPMRSYICVSDRRRESSGSNPR